MKEKQENDLNVIAAHFREPLKQPWHWVFCGDSITHGAAHTHGWRAFPEIFAERVRWELRCTHDFIINTAFSGWSTQDLLANYDTHIRAFSPNVVPIMIGTNDSVVFYEEKGHASFERNLHKLVQKLRADGIIPILQTANTILPMNIEGYVKRLEKMPEYMDVIRQTAETEDVILVDHYAHWQKEVPGEFYLAGWLGEPIHPGARGHLEMARLLMKTLNIYDENSPCCHPAGLIN